MTYVDDWRLDSSEEDIEWDIDDRWDEALTQLDCTNGNAVCLFARGLVFSVPARCKKLRDCESCRKWAWGRQYEHIGDHLLRSKITSMWIDTEVTNRELTAINRRRRELGGVAHWAWVNLPEGRTYVATTDLTQRRGRIYPAGRMEQVSIDQGLTALGDAYTRPDAMRRQRSSTWKIPRRSRLLQFGARLRIEQAIATAFGPDGNAWDSADQRRLTSREIIARFNEAYAAIN